MAILIFSSGPPFLIALRLVKIHIFLPHTPLWESLLSTYLHLTIISKWVASFKHMISSRYFSWTCTTQAWWRTPLDVDQPCIFSSLFNRWCLEDMLNSHMTNHRITPRIPSWSSHTLLLDHIKYISIHLDDLDAKYFIISIYSWHQPWIQHMEFKHLPMDKHYKNNSMQPLVHRDCH